MSSADLVLSIVQRHAEAFARGDVAALMADYTEHAVMLTKASGPLIGHQAISQLYEMIFASVFPPATTKLVFEPIIAAEGLGLLLWSATTPTHRAEAGFDSFVIKDGKITGQAGGVEFRPL